MGTVTSQEERGGFRQAVGIRACSAGVVLLAVAALLGWCLDMGVLAGFNAAWIPMAPSTAVLFLLCASSVLLRDRPWRWGARTASLGAILVAAVSLTLLLLSALGLHTGVEHLGMTVPHLPHTPPRGHMSVVTAGCFLWTATLLLTVPAPGTGSPRRLFFSLWGAGGLGAMGLVLTLAYIYGAPLFATGDFVPPAVTTSLAFLLLGGALLGLAMQAGGADPLSPRPTGRPAHALLLVFILLSVGAMSAGLLYYRRSFRQFRVEVERSLAAIAAQKVHDLTWWREERLDAASMLFENRTFRLLVRRFLHDPGNDALRLQLEDWLSSMQVTHDYAQICLHDVAGRDYLAVPPAHRPHGDVFARRMAETLQARQVRLWDFHRNQHDQRV